MEYWSDGYNVHEQTSADTAAQIWQYNSSTPSIYSQWKLMKENRLKEGRVRRLSWTTIFVGDARVTQKRGRRSHGS